MERPTSWQDDILEKIGRFEGVIIGPVQVELKRLVERKGREAGFARLALELVDDGTMKLDSSGGIRADEELVSYALREGAAVATIDHALIKQLEASHIDVLSLSGGRVDLRTH
jgi:rRNA-processing protein FCF1